jgi:hypothetical protein
MVLQPVNCYVLLFSFHYTEFVLVFSFG